MLNAIYFKGVWKNQFNKSLTKIDKFYLNSKSEVNVTLMTTYNDFNISTLKSLNARIISLPYRVHKILFLMFIIVTHLFIILQGDKFVMYVILPNSLDGLDNLINNLNPSILNESIKNMTTVFTKVVLPKFNFEYTSILAPLLKKV